MRGLRLPSGPLTVVAIGAHPDDIEIGCGGTLLTLAERSGLSVAELVLTGTPERILEARAAASAFAPGTIVDCAELADGRLPQLWAEVKSALHDFAARHPSPDLVFAPRPDDAHQDHALLGSLVSTVWRDSLILHYEIPKWDGDIGQPNAYVALEPETARRKVALLNESFPSQHGHDWWDDELFTGLMRVRGMETRSRYAEAFTIAKTALRFDD